MTVYAGKPSREPLHTAIDVVSASAATPCVVETDGAHGLLSGQYVETFLIENNRNANGRFYVEKISDDEVALYTDCSTNGVLSGPVAGSSLSTSNTGALIAISFRNKTTLPSDGVTSVTASSVNTPFQGDIDREDALANLVGREKICSFAVVNEASPTTPFGVRHNGTTPGSATWGDAVNMVPTDASSPVIMHDGDIAEVIFTGTFQALEATYVALGLRLTLKDFDGATLDTNEANSVLPSRSDQSVMTPVTILGKYVCSGDSGALSVDTVAQSITGTAITYKLIGPYSLSIKVYRSNS